MFEVPIGACGFPVHFWERRFLLELRWTTFCSLDLFCNDICEKRHREEDLSVFSTKRFPRNIHLARYAVKASARLFACTYNPIGVVYNVITDQWPLAGRPTVTTYPFTSDPTVVAYVPLLHVLCVFGSGEYYSRKASVCIVVDWITLELHCLSRVASCVIVCFALLECLRPV